MPFYVRLVSHTQKSGMPTDITGQKNVRLKAFLCTEWTKAHHRYRRHLSGVPTKLYLAFGTGVSFRVPTEGGTIVGTEKPPQEYND